MQLTGHFINKRIAVNVDFREKQYSLGEGYTEMEWTASTPFILYGLEPPLKVLHCPKSYNTNR